MNSTGGSDQAARLRELVKRRLPETPAAAGRARVLTVTSGKGGVGKTNVAANTAIALASLGRRVALVDADWALANVNILLGFSPRLTIEHVLDGQRKVGDVMIEGPGGIRILPASSGVQRLADMANGQRQKLFNALQILEKHFEILIIDTAAGMSDNVVSLLRASDEVLVVTNPEPPAFVDSYALIKHLLGLERSADIKVIVNSVKGRQEALAVFERVSSTIQRFIKGRISYLGHIIDDENVSKAVRRQRPFVLQYPNSPASVCIAALARRILEAEQGKRRAENYWSRLKNILGESTPEA